MNIFNTDSLTFDVSQNRIGDYLVPIFVSFIGCFIMLSFATFN